MTQGFNLFPMYVARSGRTRDYFTTVAARDLAHARTVAINAVRQRENLPSSVTLFADLNR